jgi:probable FeS assembly SUF system protein SufT
MKTQERVTLRRECEAIQIPSGNIITLPAGSAVRIMQSLGGMYTVMTGNGYLVRIADTDADALGKEPTAASPTAATAAAGRPEEIEQLVWEQLRTCYDPEIPVNIVDLGLVYHCQVTPVPQGGNMVEVKFTLTAPGCGMGAVLQADIESKILSVPGVEDVDVEVVFDPPWNQNMMSEVAKLELGML